MIERKKLLALLVLGGRVESRRTMPFPPRFVAVGIDDRGKEIRKESREYEIEESAVLHLVGAKWIAGKPQDALWDHVVYSVVAPALIEAHLREDFAHGFGQCPSCGEFPLRAGRKGLTPRHGANKDADIPPCKGSGEPLISTAMIPPRLSTEAQSDVA